MSAPLEQRKLLLSRSRSKRDGNESEPVRMPGTSKNRKRVLLVLQYYDHRHHAGVARYAAQAGWALEDAYTQVRTLPEKWEGDGVISFHGPSEQFVDWLKRAKIPVVDMGEDQGISDFPRVQTDNEKIAALAIEHFAQRGYRNVGYVWTFDTAIKKRREEAIAAAAAARGLKFFDLPMENIATFAAQKAFPIALLAPHDGVAVRALRACEDAGIAVPEQVALLGVDNFDYRCAPASVPLSSIDPDQERVGYEAAAMLDCLMRGEKLPSRAIRIPPIGIVERDSTDMFAVSDLEVARALRYVSQNFRRRLSLSEVAKATGLSLRRLQTRFKQQLKRTILQEINTRRVKHAQTLLAQTGKKIRVVAGECGFGSAVKLIRVFRQYAGTSPKRYRKSNVEMP
jgi:LacI family transcriptional regulator